MSIKKEYLNDYNKRICRVTFLLPKGIGKNAKRAHIVGEFNSWTHSATPMEKLKNGTFVATIELPIGREYQFRYLLDNKIWMNDSDADRFVPTPFANSENCVLTTYDDTHIEVIKAYRSDQSISVKAKVIQVQCTASGGAILGKIITARDSFFNANRSIANYNKTFYKVIISSKIMTEKDKTLRSL